MSIVNKFVEKALSLPTYAKAAIGAGVGLGVTSAVFSLFHTDKVVGLPPAANLNGFAPTLTRKEAELILNLPPNYTNQDIQKHHRTLMALHHPDKGGSPYIATKVNESRDFLTVGIRA
ncbi:DnaJ domain containing protein [Trichomonas vaginalis G3]|uniref:DnaJ domain containing protein n=1 Tax=Trichomonas vaginalis (strain ATCC PRA-98 / G3) TaxID=412133 RepID=A2DFA6_TRIV3|nr:protein transport [Trichomonas vaginalis G3]EAY20834.1 DnaJ domain containing protein [Trichomonas vaginalis G3]KAI5521558.1 protein transport [Trichomonas vaginalis G3]|eukprot:XP_001581820.1 DnaJ domain containing protein [Trichomonas vaginalis G3]